MSAPPPDQGVRDAIVAERRRNVVVIAGAGTGKTKTIIDRAVELLAPSDPTVAAIAIQRMAAITFTRRAAGELRFRLREKLLRDLEQESRRATGRAERLREALGSLDAAFIGTIHGFADRLLRLRPVEADLSPSYVLQEDDTDLIRESLARLRRAAERDQIGAELGRFGGGIAPEIVAEAAATLRQAARAGVPGETTDGGFGTPSSLEAMLVEMIRSRDVAVEAAALPPTGIEEAQAAAQSFRDLVGKLRGTSIGTAYLRRVAHSLQRLNSVVDPADAVRTVTEALRGPRPFPRQFDGDNNAAGVFATINPDRSSHWVLTKLKGPHRWLATRLVRLLPVACAMYARVKSEREVVDYLDLLIKLRDLLRDRPESRRFYQGMFDHLFVDEFQDTDPLQCEIVFLLCATSFAQTTLREPSPLSDKGGEGGLPEDPSNRSPLVPLFQRGRSGNAGSLSEACEADNALEGDGAATQLAVLDMPLRPGSLTIVGDPKQSIYRFRRADISIYGTAVERLVAGGAIECRLETNFRSRPTLIRFFNQQLSHVLGRSGGAAFDARSGRAHYEDLRSPAGDDDSEAAVHVLRYDADDGSGLLAAPGRAVEAAMWARYIARLLQEGFPVRDPDTGERRAVRPGDIAVLAPVTTNLPLLLREFDALDIEYSARGGTLWLGHPLVRRFLLALRALADRDDGVAETALLQPPFFAIDWGDAMASRVTKDATKDARRARLEGAREIVADLRRRRHRQRPGATVRDVIERTALGRSVATGRNGAQILSVLYEVAAEVDRRAALSGADFDAITETLRRWAVRPVFLDPAEPTGSDAVRVMTIHSAKGLEFPVTILWDGFQRLTEAHPGIWRAERDGSAWALDLGSVAVEHPAGHRLLERESRFGEQEGRRKYYVAATRARDLLAIPAPAAKGRFEYATKLLLHEVDEARVEYPEVFRPSRLPAWAQVPIPPLAELRPDPEGDAACAQRRQAFEQELAAAAMPIATPIGVSRSSIGDEESESQHKVAGGRHGAVFGSAVHRALQWLLSGHGRDRDRAVALAAEWEGLRGLRDELRADVDRACEALDEIGIRAGAPGVTCEYPLAGLQEAGRLVSGYIDLLSVDDRWATVIDFKTDPPPPGKIEWSYRRYAEQLQLYGELLGSARLIGKRTLRLGLLFTANGEICWLD